MSPDRPPRPRRRLLLAGLLLLLLVLAGAAVGGWLYYRGRTGNVYRPGATFVSQPAPTLAPGERRVDWPQYGFSDDHARFLPAPSKVRPPFSTRWTVDEGGLLEFPPVVSGNRIFQLADDGMLTAIDRHRGAVIWRRRVGVLAASTPVVVGGVVLATVLQRAPHRLGGRVQARRAGDGRLLWQRELPSRSESSPLASGGRVFLGSQDGTVYALRIHDGSVAWTYHAAGAVKASPTLSGGRLVFGDYSGHVQSVRAADGRRAWDTSSSGTLFGSGTFYSTAAVRYGRVFLGNTDGRVYAFDEHTGRLDWAHQTGSYVYSAPAVTNAPGLGPTVFVGSYDGTLYALDARSGTVRWRYDTHGKISGGVTVIGRIAYFADLGHYRTIGLGISTGRPLFANPNGSFDPIVSDGANLYLTGYSTLSALAPSGSVSGPRPPGPRPAPPGVTKIDLPPLVPAVSAPFAGSGSSCPSITLTPCTP